MAYSGNVFRAAALLVGGVALLVGCDSSDNGGPGSTGADKTSVGRSIAADAPRGYDPCKDIPAPVLASEKLTMSGRADSDADGGIRWRGCRFGRTDGYATSIRTTNLTIEMLRAKNFPETQEFTIAGRRAISTRQFAGDYIKEACTVNVEMKGGSLEFNLNNPPSNRDTGSIDSCVLARSLAEKVVPTVPGTT